MRKVAFLPLFVGAILQAQSINISDFYYRDYLDFGQNKGSFSSGNPTLTGKDGTSISVPNVPNFAASSNYGSLTSVGRGFAVTANHVESPNNVSDLRQWGLTSYTIGKEDSGDSTIDSTSKIYGYDTKFSRFTKYIVEGQVGMLDIDNNKDNKTNFENLVKSDFKDAQGNVYLYQAGSGIVKLNGTKNHQEFYTDGTGERRGGGFGTFGKVEDYNNGIAFYYVPQTGFYNQITSGDSGSGIYAYSTKDNKWVLLGVVSRDNGAISFASNKDFMDYQKQFEQKIDLSNSTSWTLEKPVGSEIQIKNNGDSKQLQGNKDMIFSGNGEINIEVKADIDRTQSGYAGGFVFESSTNPTTYKFTNENGKTHSFKGSGLDIGENVVVEWALRNKSGESLHKIGKGELIIKTTYTPNSTENLGYLKLGEGKVTLDTTSKAFEGIYITSGRGEVALKTGKAEAIGAVKDGANALNSNSYTLTQEDNKNMGFYFGTGGGRFDLAGNSLTLNTIAANDSGATITNSSGSATLTIEGFGYKENGDKDKPKVKDTTKADTIIHATIGESGLTNGANQANIDIVYSGNNATNNATTRHSERSEESKNNNMDSVDSSATKSPQNDKAGAFLIFDGNINTSGKMSVNNGNIALQGHATTHATISNETIRNQVANAESGTQKGMPDYMDLSKPSTLTQPDWDKRTFKFGSIDLKGANLTLGRNASLDSAITLDSTSKVEFGGSVTHFIDNFDGKNVTGSGFSYQQKVESGTIGDEQTKIANQTISYKGTITANGGTIQSHIWNFNASLDLKGGAKLTADYLTLTHSDSVKLENGASASVKTLKLQNVGDSDLNTIFQNGTNPKLKVTESFWFDSVSNLNLDKLESANIDKTQNYDIVGVKSTITGTNKDLNANIGLFDNANLSLKKLTLKNTSADSSDSNALKNSVYLKNSATESTFTKLSLTESLRAENLDKAQIILSGKSEISAPKIEFSGVQNGILALDSEAKLTGVNGSNANVEVSGENSTLNIGMLGDKSFNITAQGGSTIILSSLRGSEATEAIQNENSGLPRIANGNSRNDETVASANFSGKITAKDSSVVATDLGSITASVDLSGSANLVAKNITLDSTHNSIALKDNAKLTADIITAKNLSDLTLNATNNANVDIKSFIFDGGTTNLTGNLIGKNIELKSSTLKTTSDLTFTHSATLTLDDKSKLEMTNLKVDNANLTLNFADSATSTTKLQNINLNNNANLTINSWDFGNKTQFSSNGNSRVTFENATYTQNGTPKTIGADSTISGTLTLLNVGEDSTKGNDRFKTLEFSKKLSLESGAKLEVNFAELVKKDNADLQFNQYYKIFGATSLIYGKNLDIKLNLAGSGSDFFAKGKFDNNAFFVEFVRENPRNFAELNPHINPNYSAFLDILLEHNEFDESIEKAINMGDYSALNARLAGLDKSFENLANADNGALKTLPLLQKQEINARIQHTRFSNAKFALARVKNPTQQSDIVPKLLYLENEERKNRAWSNASASFFTNNGDKFSLQSLSIGYDRKLFGDEFLLGVMMSATNAQLSSNETNYNPKIYALALYSDALFSRAELQNELSFSLLNGDRDFEGESGSYKSFHSFFESIYKAEFAFLPQSVKPLALARVNLSRFDEFSTATYKQKADNDISVDLGLGFEWLWQKENGFYSATFIAERDIFHSQKESFISLKNAQKFIAYKTNEPSFSYQLYFSGLENFKNGFYLRYGLSAFIDSKAYKGVKGDVQVGYKF